VRLGARVSRLERSRSADGPCPECGHGSGEPPKFIVSFGDEPVERPDRCPRCGRPRLVVFRLTYYDPKEPDAP
jgi:DNA-directed RNA polymerase subunit RPC12/RpoP